MKKKVLIFTYYFPPAGGVAVQRFLKFSKFLPQFGWEPIVVTVANGSYPYYDESLLKEISPALKVYRTKTFEPFEFYNLLKGKRGKAMPVVAVGDGGAKSIFQRLSEYVRANFFIPDARKGWVPYAIKQAEEILRTEKIDTIITTGPPHSTHLIGLELKKKYGVKWLADFRDPWTKIFYNNILPRTQATIEADKRLEREVLTNADLVTVISPGLQREFAYAAKKCRVICNGYDEEDFLKSEIRNLPAGKAGPKSEMFIVRYVGNLMASENPENFWKAVAGLVKERKKIKIELIGRIDNPVKESIRANGIETICDYKDFVEHKQATQLMQTCNLLLFLIPNVPDNKLILTGKLFEYLGSGTPLISFGPVDGDAAEILKQTGRTPMIAYNDFEETKKQLAEAINNQTSKLPAEYHSQFSRVKQTEVLAGLLNEL
ncbi:MAG: glycosyltransferase family 4 protein [Chitinophagales bacterium]|nr:glycosyltransferase family 4 protein [Chitinophagales bacterium]